MKVRYKRAALLDLRAIRDYGVTHWGVPRTIDFIEDLIERIEAACRDGRSGRPRDEIAKGVRSIRHRGYLAFFVDAETDQIVLAVISERQDLAALDFADRLQRP